MEVTAWDVGRAYRLCGYRDFKRAIEEARARNFNIDWCAGNMLQFLKGWDSVSKEVTGG
jgi:hypothetical protein